MTSIAAKPAKGGAPTKLYSVPFDDTTIEYDVRRSRRRKKTVQVRVDGNGVHVATPMRTTHSALRDIVLKQAPWILKRMSLAVEEVAPKRFVTGETLPYLGRSVKMIVETAEVTAPEVRFDHWRFRVDVPCDLDDAKREDVIRHSLIEWYKSRAADKLAAGLERWWPKLGRGEKSRVLIRDHRRQWGSCAADGTLRFSWRLVMTKPALIEYVIVHELAHLTHRNHSADFWDLVYEVMPDARQRRKQLYEAARLLPVL